MMVGGYPRCFEGVLINSHAILRWTTYLFYGSSLGPKNNLQTEAFVGRRVFKGLTCWNKKNYSG